jgi:hypothetical protein
MPDGMTLLVTRQDTITSDELITYGALIRETIRDFLRNLPEGDVLLETITRKDGSSYPVKFQYHSSGNKLAVVTERISRGLDPLCEISPEGVIDVSTLKQPSIGEYLQRLSHEYKVEKIAS